MGSHQAARPTPPSSVKLCRVLLRRHIQSCATYMHFEGVSFFPLVDQPLIIPVNRYKCGGRLASASFPIGEPAS